MRRLPSLSVALLLSLAGCGDDAEPTTDAGLVDATTPTDAEPDDAGSTDAGPVDAGNDAGSDAATLTPALVEALEELASEVLEFDTAFDATPQSLREQVPMLDATLGRTRLDGIVGEKGLLGIAGIVGEKGIIGGLSFAPATSALAVALLHLDSASTALQRGASSLNTSSEELAMAAAANALVERIRTLRDELAPQLRVALASEAGLGVTGPSRVERRFSTLTPEFVLLDILEGSATTSTNVRVSVTCDGADALGLEASDLSGATLGATEEMDTPLEFSIDDDRPTAVRIAVQASVAPPSLCSIAVDGPRLDRAGPRAVSLPASFDDDWGDAMAELWSALDGMYMYPGEVQRVQEVVGDLVVATAALQRTGSIPVETLRIEEIEQMHYARMALDAPLDALLAHLSGSHWDRTRGAVSALRSLVQRAVPPLDG